MVRDVTVVLLSLPVYDLLSLDLDVSHRVVNLFLEVELGAPSLRFGPCSNSWRPLFLNDDLACHRGI
jgi:hypothetical protein